MKPISKGYYCIPEYETWPEDDSIIDNIIGTDVLHGMIINASTENEARGIFEYQFEGDVSNASDIQIKDAPKYDLFQPKMNSVASGLSIDKRTILANSNGNNGDKPGFRSHYCGDKHNDNLLDLVADGLMTGPHDAFIQGGGGGYAYFVLTPKGKETAFSLLPVKRKDLDA